VRGLGLRTLRHSGGDGQAKAGDGRIAHSHNLVRICPSKTQLFAFSFEFLNKLAKAAQAAQRAAIMQCPVPVGGQWPPVRSPDTGFFLTVTSVIPIARLLPRPECGHMLQYLPCETRQSITRSQPELGDDRGPDVVVVSDKERGRSGGKGERQGVN